MMVSTFPKSTWRLVRTPPSYGAWNMAVDEAILESIVAGDSLSTLRLFAWFPPCLSLGYAQPFLDVDPVRLSTYGWNIVRRITGGRAILHTDELTYSVIGPESEPRLAGSVIGSYRILSQALLAALKSLGIPANALPKSQAETTNPQKKEPICFEVPSNYEITVYGKKLIGSAQARKNGGILQHGTLPLSGDLTRIVQVLFLQGEDSRAQAQERLLERATTVEKVLGTQVSWDAAASAFIQGFRDTLNLELIDSKITPEERKRVEVLVKEKYAHPDWTERI